MLLILESPSIPAIYPAIKGGFAFALIDSKIHLVQFLALYYHSTTGNYHSYAKEPITDVDIISNVSCKVYINLQNNIFYSTSEDEHELFLHLSSKQIIYYLGSQVSISVKSMNSMNMITLHSTAFKIYKILTDEKILLSILHCLNI